MKASWSVGARRWEADLTKPSHLAIGLRFEGAQPGAFFLPPATASAVEAGDFVGDTRRGGGANCETVTLNPHGNGTHTECVGHILDERVAVHEAVQDVVAMAALVTVSVQAIGESRDSYGAAHELGDKVITASALEAGWTPQMEGATALVLRTVGSQVSPVAQYSGHNPAFVSREAMQWIRARGIVHLLLDLPSVDRENDGGALECHHLFWSVPEGRHDYQGQAPEEEAAGRRRSITEMIAVSENLNDGVYLLHLQLAPFMLDAAPSRPTLCPAYLLSEDSV